MGLSKALPIWILPGSEGCSLKSCCRQKVWRSGPSGVWFWSSQLLDETELNLLTEIGFDAANTSR